MAAAGLEAGAVYSYHYLWSREADAGEESRRKSRPACLLITLSGQADRLYMFAITSRPPAAGRIAEELNQLECKRCGLTAPAWIMLDEFNVTPSQELHDFESLRPLGKLSPAFCKAAISKAILADRAERSRAVIRN